MQKRILSFILSLVLLVGLLSGCGTPKLSQNGDVYEIKTAADLLEIAKEPEGDYILLSDLDMTGIDWTPIADFSGNLDGNNKTISNLAIDEVAPKSKDMGLFGNITAEGSVKDLLLKDVTIHAEKTKAENIGTFVGTLEGKLSKVMATGVIYDDRENVNVGCLAGVAKGNADVEGDKKLSFQDAAGVFTTEYLAADVKLFVAENTNRGLVGKLEGDAYATGFWRDSFYSSERQSETIRTRQQKVVDYMYKMGTQLWSVTKTMTHYGTADEKQKRSHIHTQTFKPGEIYYGIPYDHTSGSYERLMFCLDENNTMKDWATALGDSTWGGDLGFTKYIGNDCSAAVAWSWMQVSPSAVGTDSGAHVFLTSQMIPNLTHQDLYGIYPVGSWNGEKFTEKGATYSVMALETSPDVFKANGMDKMMEAYAQTRKADGLVFGNPGGHVRLVAEDPVVIRDGAGKIDTKRSYFLCHEQGDGLYNNRYEGTNSSWRINYRYSFEVLANGSEKRGRENQLEAGSGNCYIPITIHALQQEEIPAPYAKAEITSPAEGKITSNYRIQSTQVTVQDSAGKVVYDKQAFVAVDAGYPDNRGPLTAAFLQDDHGAALAGLAPGSYTYTVKVLLSNSEVHTVAENVAYQHN